LTMKAVHQKANSQLLEDMSRDERSIVHSMVKDGLLPADLGEAGISLEESEEFYAKLGRIQLAKAAVFARQDAALALMTVHRVRQDLAELKTIRLLLWIILIGVGFIAGRI